MSDIQKYFTSIITVSNKSSWFSIATNQEHILIYQSSKLYLYFISSENVFYLDKIGMNFRIYSIPDKDTIKGKLFSERCYNQTLFLSIRAFGSSIYQYEIFLSIELFKECKSLL
jgi:hypothetical protein